MEKGEHLCSRGGTERQHSAPERSSEGAAVREEPLEGKRKHEKEKEPSPGDAEFQRARLMNAPVKERMV